MKLFTIDNENNITLHASAQEADAVANAERFRNEAQLAKIAAEWPMARLVEIWNGLPGVTAVTKFKDRATAVARIWKAIQTLGGAEPEAGRIEAATPAKATTVAPQGADVAPAEGTSEEQATPAETPTEMPAIDEEKCAYLLRKAGEAQHAYWDRLAELEKAEATVGALLALRH